MACRLGKRNASGDAMSFGEMPVGPLEVMPKDGHGTLEVGSGVRGTTLKQGRFRQPHQVLGDTLLLRAQSLLKTCRRLNECLLGLDHPPLGQDHETQTVAGDGDLGVVATRNSDLRDQYVPGVFLGARQVTTRLGDTREVVVAADTSGR